MTLDSCGLPIYSLMHPLKEKGKGVGLVVLTRVPGLGTGFIQEPCFRVPNSPLMCSVTGCNGQMSPDTMLLLLV